MGSVVWSLIFAVIARNSGGLYYSLPLGIEEVRRIRGEIHNEERKASEDLHFFTYPPGLLSTESCV